jgi:cob(I)alamin adenosyltransferase
MTRAFNLKIKRVEAKEVEIKLRVIQNELFDAGSELATPQEVFIKGMPQIEKEQIRRLEQEMDLYQKEVLPLKSFVLPGGGIISSLLHHCRTVCRRTEREIFRLGNSDKINPHVFIYINRLSDWFFVLSRWVSKRYGEKESLWERGLSKGPPLLKRKKKPIRRK